MQQLENIAGGLREILLHTGNFTSCTPQEFVKFINESGRFPNHSVVALDYSSDFKIIALFVNDGTNGISAANLVHSEIQYDKSNQTYTLHLKGGNNGNVQGPNILLNITQAFLDSSINQHIFKGAGDNFTIEIENGVWLEEGINIPIGNNSISLKLVNLPSESWNLQNLLHGSYISHLVERTNQDLDTLERNIPGLIHFRENLEKKPHTGDNKPYYSDDIDYLIEHNLPATKGQIDKVISELQKATNWSRTDVFNNVCGLQELYDRATGLSRNQKIGIGIGVAALAGLTICLGAAYFGEQNNDKGKNKN